MTTFISKHPHHLGQTTTSSLIERLTPHLLEHYQWSSEELSDYTNRKQLQLFTCAQEALMAFLNLADQPAEAAKQAYQRITQLPLDDIPTLGGFHPWMNHVFQLVTSDYGDILEIDGQSYYVILKES